MARLSRLACLIGVLGLFVNLSDMRAHASPAAHDGKPVLYVDLHVDLPYQHVFKHAGLLASSGQYVASSAKKAGSSAVVLPLFVPARVSPGGPRMQDYEACWERFAASLREQTIYAAPDHEPAADQIRTFYSFEGMGPFTDDRAVLQRWVQRGVRLFGLVHNQSNALAAAALDRRGTDFGLSELGRRVVTQIYALGGIVDVSHASSRTTRDVLDLAEQFRTPVIASHSNARHLLDHPRNLDDDIIDRIARTGGIIGVNFHSPFLAKRRRATLADVVNQIRYLVSRVGADHVAIGSDYEGDIRPPIGLASVAEVPNLVAALRQAALSSREIEAIMGANALRLLVAGHGAAKSP
jgi:membrane dipeptidase